MISVAIFIFPEVEVLDFAGPYEVFTTACRVAKMKGDAAPFSVFTVAREPGTIRARAGLVVNADYTFANHPPIDVVIIPGGVVDAELKTLAVAEWIKHVASPAAQPRSADFQSAVPQVSKPAVPRSRLEVCGTAPLGRSPPKLAASVCTGAFLLAQAGLLDGKTVTTHWEDIEELRTTFPALTVVEGRRWVDEGSVVTSAGISAGIDMSLHLVERLTNRELAEGTARRMEFDWREND